MSVFWPENSSVAACENLCLRTLGCKGVEFRLGACEIWTFEISASVWAPGRHCYRFEPFQSVDGFSDRVCRGANSTDSMDSYYAIYNSTVVPTLEACQQMCATTDGCQGVEYRGWCEVWTRPAGINAVAFSPGSQCLRYQPFIGMDGGSNRACRGMTPSDSWSSFYDVYGPAVAKSLDDCKALCISTKSCRGIGYREDRCEVWTRRPGIGASIASAGSVCLRFGIWDAVSTNDAFMDTSAETCRGASNTSHTLWGPGRVPTEHACRLLCMSTRGCTGIAFGPDGCRVWSAEGLVNSAPVAGERCLRYDPFEVVDGGADRACRGESPEDDSNSNYMLASEPTSSIEECKMHCTNLAGCKGISYSLSGCQLWTRELGIQSSAPLVGSTCLRHMPFTAVNGGTDQACRGAHGGDIDDSYFKAFPLDEVHSLEVCRLRCASTPNCTGVEFNALGCRVWTLLTGIQATAHIPGATCMRYGKPNLVSDVAAFKPVDGATDRACRGRNETDNLDTYYVLYWTWPENSSLDACQQRCAPASVLLPFQTLCSYC